METISRDLLTFLLNALWQVALVSAVAALACRLMRRGPASHRLAVWTAALAAAVLLPLVSARRAQAPAVPQFDPSWAASGAAPDVPAAPTRTGAAPAATSAAPTPRTVELRGNTARILTGAYLLFLLAGFARLALAWKRTRAIYREAQPSPAPESLQRVWDRCQAAFGVAGARLLFSDRISGPVTAGRAIILPSAMRGGDTPEDVLTTAIGHEMAHLARRDFAGNLLFRALRLPVGFHPGAWTIGRGIEGAREMACDELVTARLIEPDVYARSMLKIAASIAMPSRAAYALGVLDGDNFEQRIRSLLERRPARLERARLWLITGLAALAICSIAASGLALTARAQPGASDSMKKGAAAYSRSDYQEAARQFGLAAQLEPANLKAKLWLASALLAQSQPGADAANPVAALAKQQYQGVLAIDPRNQAALDGMMMVAANTRQFAEAQEWALKAIAANASDSNAYYMAGFIDWRMAYPDYAAARKAAGMAVMDAGVIPDAALREQVREKHGAQVEDGLRMLQTALQLNPDSMEAAAYMNLLFRIQAGLADTPEEAADYTAQADRMVELALAAKRRIAENPPPAAKPLDADGPVPSPFAAPPPPPPPPPPPGGQAPRVDGAIHVSGRVQAAKLISGDPPVYPVSARQSRIEGEVVLEVTIGKDGTIQSANAVSGDPVLAGAAIAAVRNWRYQPTLLNAEPVEVISQVTVNFTLGQ